jgi:hypothetical protein
LICYQPPLRRQPKQVKNRKIRLRSQSQSRSGGEDRSTFFSTRQPCLVSKTLFGSLMNAKSTFPSGESHLISHHYGTFF